MSFGLGGSTRIDCTRSLLRLGFRCLGFVLEFIGLEYRGLENNLVYNTNLLCVLGRVAFIFWFSST